jgi:hypothetical protein
MKFWILIIAILIETSIAKSEVQQHAGDCSLNIINNGRDVRIGHLDCGMPKAAEDKLIKLFNDMIISQGDIKATLQRLQSIVEFSTTRNSGREIALGLEDTVTAAINEWTAKYKNLISPSLSLGSVSDSLKDALQKGQLERAGSILDQKLQAGKDSLEDANQESGALHYARGILYELQFQHDRRFSIIRKLVTRIVHSIPQHAVLNDGSMDYQLK